MSKYSEDDPMSRKERREERKIARKKDRSKYKKTDREKRARLEQEKSDRRLAKKEGLLRGRILAIAPDEISVQSEETVYPCTLRGSLKKEITRAKNLITIGDFVLFEPSSLGIIHIETRTSLLSRQEHLRRHQEQLIAANIDQVLITTSVCAPQLKPHLIDRYIIATYKGGMEPVIVINKIDLLENKSDEEALFQALVAAYEAIDIPVIALSAKTGEGIERLKSVMRDKASVFSGQSGVGKSSLINAMTGLDLAVKKIVEKTRKGTHTTSRAKLIPLDCGGWCIDTPGIRSFGVWDLTREEIADYFPEIQAYCGACKFPNCTHIHEPECAVLEALEEGKIPELRYSSYLRLCEEIVV